MVKSSVYPALGQYFRTVQDLADAACIGRTRATDCLAGRKDFSPQEKKAIWNCILVRHFHLSSFELNGDLLTDLDQAFRVPKN